MLDSGAVLFRERGVTATAFADVLAHSGAPRGSVYHHFPGGKEQFAEEVVAYAGRAMSRRFSRAAEGDDDLHAILDDAVDHWMAIVRDSDFRAGCPVAAGAVEGGAEEGLRAAAGEAFGHWTDRLERLLAGRGVPADRARGVATLVLASLQGAILLARSRRTVEPIEAVRAELHAALDAATRPSDGAGA